MDTLSWILQTVLAVSFAATGLVKLTRRREKLATTADGSNATIRAPLLKLVGATEVCAAVAVMVPAGGSLLPALAAIAAVSVLEPQQCLASPVTRPRRWPQRRDPKRRERPDP